MRRERTLPADSHARTIREERLGSITEHRLAGRQQTSDRFDRGHPLILTATIGPWYRENIPASSANITMRLLNLQTSSTNPAAASLIYNSGAGADVKMHNAGRVVGAMIFSSSTITAGSVVAGVCLDSDTATKVTALSDCVLNTTNPMSYLAWLGWRRGIPFAALQSVEPVVTTDSAFLPVTADVQVALIIGWREPD